MMLVASTTMCFAQPQTAALKAGDWVSGKAVVIDGDSIRVDGHLVRLHGIDAPEIEQHCYSGNLLFACGEESASYLADMIYDQHVSCQINEVDDYNRFLGSCKWKEKNVAEIMVLAGQALAWPHHSDLYVSTERLAQSKKIGIWATDFARPHEWRLAVERKKAQEKRRSAIKANPQGGRKVPTFSSK